MYGYSYDRWGNYYYFDLYGAVDGTPHHVSASMRRCRRDDELGLVERNAHIVRHRHAVGQRDVRKIHDIRAPRRHVVDERRIARPQPHVVAHPSQVHGQRGAPAPGADDGDVRH